MKRPKKILIDVTELAKAFLSYTEGETEFNTNALMDVLEAEYDLETLVYPRIRTLKAAGAL